MAQNVWFIAAIWMAIAFSASVVSIWTGVSVALVEILAGVIAGNLFHLQANTEWISFLALLGSGVLYVFSRSKRSIHNPSAQI